MKNEDRIIKLQNGTDTSRWAAEEILSLQEQVKQLTANLENKTEIANQLKDGLTDSFETQLGLKAQVNQLQNAALDVYGLIDGGDDKVKLCEALKSTPEHCLSQVRALAVENFVGDAINELSETLSIAYSGFGFTDSGDLTNKKVIITDKLNQFKNRYIKQILNQE